MSNRFGTIAKARLNRLYKRYNRREFVHPDPLEFLYEYDDPLEREVVGLVASSLAYGRVAQILRSVSVVLKRTGPPAAFLRNATPQKVRRTFADFKHRFTTGEELSRLLLGAGAAIKRKGSLQACFLQGFKDCDETVLPALCAFTDVLAGGRGRRNSLLPSPGLGSACKRLNLFLRWMVRRDGVDPGGWDGISTSKLIVPLDIHMHRMSLRMGFTRRKQANMITAIEVTEAFRQIAPQDPTRYDFVLTRFGIRDDLDAESYLPGLSTSMRLKAHESPRLV